MRVNWTHAALDNLDEAVEYITQGKPTAAADVARRIWDATQRLAEQPGMGRPGRIGGTRELVIAGLPYIVPYTIEGDQIFILRVVHTSMKWPKRL